MVKIVMYKKNKKKFFAKAGLNVFVYLSMLFYIFIITGCSKSEVVNSEIVEEVSVAVEIDQWFPALWINGLEYTYQPLYANKTKLVREARVTDTVYFTSIGIPFTIESNDLVSTNYIITKKNGELVESGSAKPRDVQGNQSYLFDIIPIDLNDYSQGEKYNLEITLTINGQEAYYYLDLFFGNTDGNLKSVEKVYNYLKKDMKAHDVSFLNIPRFWIDVQEDGTALVRSEFTGATRLDEGFEYIDYIKLFNVDILNGNITQESQYMVDKQRYYYSSEDLGWVMGNQLFIGEDTTVFSPYIRKLYANEHNNSQLIYSDYDLFLYNQTTEEMKEIYRLDTFDSDYIYDEYQQHRIKVLNYDTNGDVYFAVLGYIHDGSKHNQKTGIGFYKYNNEGLTNLDFIEKEGTINQLDAYMKNNSYYSVSLNRLYFFENQLLYMFDLVNNNFSYIDAYLKADFNNNTGVLSWQGYNSKFNGGVFIVNLNEESLEVKDLYQTGVCKRLLGNSDNYIFVGDYYVEDTYEALDGQITYPFSYIKVYDFNGEELVSYDHLDYGETIFFSGVYFDEVSNQWKCDLIERQFDQKEISKNSRINFVQTNGPIILDEFKSLISDTKINIEQEEVSLISVYPEGLIYTKDKAQDIIFLSKTKIINTTSSTIYFDPNPKKDVYKIVDYNGDILYTSRLIDALKKTKEKRDYRIYYSQYIEYGKTKDELLFDSSSLLTSQYLEEITILSQRPELPRGCEVTSLSILLDYYLDVAPGKMELAAELKTSTIEYKVIDGFVNYANMHYEFAGSMSDRHKPGLGVYIEPIKILADHYTDYNPTNITGISFEQLLTFVSNNQPVLIIIPNRYQVVANYGIEVWKTNSGYMEVTYQEHSVVIMGFDENYVYYSDPSKGIIDKKSIQSFKNAWESIGSQGLVILD